MAGSLAGWLASWLADWLVGWLSLLASVEGRHLLAGGVAGYPLASVEGGDPGVASNDVHLQLDMQQSG